MLPILTKSELEVVDRATMANEPILPAELMARAGMACAERIILRVQQWRDPDQVRFVVLVGWGNNGGDGLVIARIVFGAGFEVRVWRVGADRRSSPEFLHHLELATRAGVSIDQRPPEDFRIRPSDRVVFIDCLFGRGSKAIQDGPIRDLVEQVNASGRPIFSVDAPSGMVPAAMSTTDLIGVQATVTFALEVPRLEMLLAETGPAFGDWELVPIGLDRAALEGAAREAEWVERADIRSTLVARSRFGHKGTFGHALLIAGSKGMYGAAVLATKGCLRSGVGLVTAHLPSEAGSVLASLAPDAMTSLDPSEDRITALPDLGRYDAIGVGPGIGKHGRTDEVLDELLTTFNRPLVLDADALNVLARDPRRVRKAKGPVVLTPHPAEMDRLLGKVPTSSYERLQLTRALAMDLGCTIVLKGAHTAICDQMGRVHFNSTGNHGMAKGGSGDVLTGILTGLMAQGYPALDACSIGVHLHGLAGDVAAERSGHDAMRPSDLIECIGDAWKTLRHDLE